ncbi:MAG: nucleotide sugar dehydrogenase [Proteobacteria bacterium]|nr:nucleotide sugar dehydrogenase [Pseudomonadota bacterium]
MSPTPPAKAKIALLGLGYVGLPLALALSRHYSVSAYDISKERIAELKDGFDRTGEISASVLGAAALDMSDGPGIIEGADYFIITVPTPVDENNQPDLQHVIAACATIGKAMKKGSVVVLESTVYPGVTEDVCGPELEAASGLTSGEDFFLGYSPERINPGDKEHAIDKITKVVAGQTPEVAAKLSDLYGAITSGGVFVAKDIRTAEAAKVIENAQRDINIAFINEVSMIFNRLGLNTYDVLETAGTKWNFLPFEPGLVGGHCIGVDPYYLAHMASDMGYHPGIILAGRKINDAMAGIIAGRINDMLGDGLGKGEGGKALVLGLTFKENVPDLRNTKAVDLINALKAHGHDVDAHDAMADADEVEQFFGLTLLDKLPQDQAYDCVVGTVSHDEYSAFDAETLTALVKPGGLVVDLKGMWRDVVLGPDIKRMEI